MNTEQCIAMRLRRNLMRIVSGLTVAVFAGWIALPLVTNAAEQTQATQPAATVGELIIERPTLICLGFEWRVQGDENYNAAVSVRFRRKGTTEWHDYLPLLRIGKGREVPPGYGNFDDPHHEPLYKTPKALPAASWTWSRPRRTRFVWNCAIRTALRVNL